MRRSTDEVFGDTSKRIFDEVMDKCDEYCKQKDAQKNGSYYVAVSTAATAVFQKFFVNRVSDLEDKVKALQVQNAAKDGQIEELQGQVKALQIENADKDGQIKELQGQVKTLVGRLKALEDILLERN